MTVKVGKECGFENVQVGRGGWMVKGSRRYLAGSIAGSCRLGVGL